MHNRYIYMKQLSNKRYLYNNNNNSKFIGQIETY